MAKRRWGQGPYKKGNMFEVSAFLQEKMGDHVRTKLFNIFRDTIMATPVDTGRLRNNWNASLNAIDTSTTSGKGSSKLGLAKEVRDKFELGDTAYFANNLPYALTVELGSSKTQAPDGMLRISVRNNI